MIKRVAAAVMLLLGLCGLWPLVYGTWMVSTLPSDQLSLSDTLGVLLTAIVAAGSALVVGAAWLFSTTKRDG
ncbi:MAG: hypothetical protein EOP62_12610 [Sphingomonadales bacterium]|nr:MAG: hypothetical protein EOP62_12610 [Sphingomonadales bacterium]